MGDERSQPKQNRCVEKGKKQVLVYNTEKGVTTECFIQTLKTHLGGFEFENFAKASAVGKVTLPIIAVVRHTIIRIGEVLNEVNRQLVKEKVDGLERVFVVYFYVNKSDEGCKQEIKQVSGHFNFAKILTMNFVESCLHRKYFGLQACLKPENEDALRELRCILSRMKLCVKVYGAGDSDRVKAFLAEFDQKISSSIKLQVMEPLDMLEELNSETSPTLTCTTDDVEKSLRKLKEKGLKKVFLVHIIDVGKKSEIRVMHDSPDDMENTSEIHEEQNLSSTLPVGAGNNTAQNGKNMSCEMYKVLYYDGKFKVDFDLVKQFETFVANGLMK